ncbi:hypothetical protein A8709_07380 [Paenibacillus pectinilyticus]|uniref:peptidylprolyl isomerase n=2 Tax=Paenibacillus pectinilyticus TaxID=512399 RepID=A0A1C0ZTV5_9BACL|nr:hypothetical protein A8709_07380 [Paenibacillus pectinilyticus]
MTAAIILIIVLGVLGGWVFVRQDNLNSNSTIALVNGEPISYQELLQVMNHMRSLTQADQLANKALQTLVSNKIEQMWAKQKGLVDRIDYAHFHQQWKEENLRRKEAVAKKQPIYGPTQYSEGDYYRYVQSNVVIQLKDALGKNEFAQTTNQLKAQYESIKEQKFKKPASIRIQKLVLSSKDSLAQSKMEQARAALLTGEAFEEVAKRYTSQSGIEQFFDANRRKQDSELYATLIEVSENLAIGQISQVFQDADKWIIVKCVERTKDEYEELDNVKSNVQAIYTDEQYSLQLAVKMKSANVEINREAFDQIAKD